MIVDHAENYKSKTGNFELIYLQPTVHCNNNINMNNMKVSGKPLPKNYFCLEEDKNAKRIKPLSITENLQMEKSLSRSKSEILTKGVKETLENLLAFIQSEKKRRQKKKFITKGNITIIYVSVQCTGCGISDGFEWKPPFRAQLVMYRPIQDVSS